MKSIEKFLEEKLGQKVTLLEYKGNEIDDGQVIIIGENKYILKFEEKDWKSEKKGFYLEVEKKSRNIISEFLEEIGEKFFLIEDQIGLLVIREEAYLEASEIRDSLETELFLESRIVDLGILKNEKDAMKKSEMARTILLKNPKSHTSKRVFTLRDIVMISIFEEMNIFGATEIINLIFKGKNPLEIDLEILNTAKTLMKNDLNIAKTAKDMYIHRNTLIYRIEKIKEIFDLDLKVFEDAYYFKLGLSLLEIERI